MILEIEVIGTPQPAGSKRAFPYRKAGGDKLGVRVADDNPKAAAWKDQIAWAARERMLEGAHKILLGPVLLQVCLYFKRPAGHYRGDGKSLNKKGLATPRPITKPDALKCLRAIEDALTEAGVWRDDAQVVLEVVSKHYSERPGARITIQALPAHTAVMAGVLAG